MLRRLWADHRNACLLSLALLVVGVLVNPWLLLAAVLPIGWVLLKKKPAQDEQPQVTTTPIEETDSIEPLTGPALLAKIKELGDVSKSELVRSCGYCSINSDGSERLNFTGFYVALLEAKGVSLNLDGTGGAGVGKGGRKLSYLATVQGNGNLLIGKAYTALLELKPGDECEIKLDGKQIILDFAKAMGSLSKSKLSYLPAVQGNGNLLIGKAYTALLELKPGDEYEIKLDGKQIILELPKDN